MALKTKQVPGGLVKTQTAGPTSRVWGSAGLGFRWMIGISIEFPLLLLLSGNRAPLKQLNGVKSRTIRP